MHAYTAQQVRDAEAPHLAVGEPLMQRAAHGLAQEIRRLIDTTEAATAAGGAGDPRPSTVLLLVGSGSNGGDALFAGAELAQAGSPVRALALGSRLHEAGAAAARAGGVEFPDVDPALIEALPTSLGDVSVIVDGILGIGVSSGSLALRGPAREVVGCLLAAGGAQDAPGSLPPVVAVDVPSGIDPDTGETADDVVLPATVTVTFGGVKAGLLGGRGAELAGEIVLVPIGIEEDLALMHPVIRRESTTPKVADSAKRATMEQQDRHRADRG
ncbi:NAD(P)H-hydrate epimerase [Herbiconiux sp. P15]|uniref:NAD(P)H-hydrate epimerase n=1 Tax=Herbiconiux liukaitaii TaxID=3342799 RepID=UPI0035B81A37